MQTLHDKLNVIPEAAMYFTFIAVLQQCNTERQPLSYHPIITLSCSWGSGYNQRRGKQHESIILPAGIVFSIKDQPLYTLYYITPTALIAH